MRTVYKIAVVLLALCLTAGGCAGGDTRWVYESGGNQISAGLYILYQLDALESAKQKIQAEHTDDAEYQLPAQKELLKQMLEGQTVSDWINQKAQESCREWIAVAAQYDSRGLSFTASDKSSIDGNADSVWAQKKDSLEPNGVSIDSVRDYYANLMRENYLFDALYESDGELAVSDDELRGIFEKDFAKVEFMTITRPTAVPEGETKTLEQLDADAKAKAEDYMKRLKEGAAIEDLTYEYELSQAADDQKESVTKPEKSQTLLIITEAYRQNYGDKLTDAALGSSVGIPKLVEETYYYAVINRLDILSDPADYENYRYTILYNLKSGDFNAKITEWASAVEPAANQAALSRYQPSKLKPAAAS